MKSYKVSVKNKPHVFYYVDAPSRRVARWCALNLYDNEYLDGEAITIKDLRVEKE